MPRQPALLFLFGLTCCLAEQPAEGAGAAPLLLRACDARGQPTPLTSLPRQPLLQLEIEGLTDPDGAPWLFAGAMDEALLRDLARLPLTAASQERLVPLRRARSGRDLLLTPLSPLRAAASYSLALPASATQVDEAWSAALRVADSAQAGAALRGSFPAPGAVAVSRQLAWAALSFDGEVSGFEDGIWLEDAAGFAVAGRSEAVACEALDTAAVSCIRFTPDAPLSAGARYALRSGRALQDAHGAELPELYSELGTAVAAEPAGALWQPASCALDEQALAEGCALVLDDRIALQLFPAPSTRVLIALGAQRTAALPAAAGVSIELTGLTPDTEHTLMLAAIDVAQREHVRQLGLRTAPALRTLSISEVYADPSGKEPDQEFVELWNFGNEAVPLGNLYLSDSSDSRGMHIASDASLGPGARALLVSAGYAADSGLDVAPRAGSLLVRVGKALTSGGLSNRGEPLYLRDAGGQRLSAAPGRPAPRAGQCLTRVGSDPRTGEPGSFDYVGAGTCTPGF